MPHHSATIRWSNDAPEQFAQGRYARAHDWVFDGGQTVRASSSTGVVRPPLSDPFGVDPEEALIAAVSSCHMLWFLDLVRRAGHGVASYEDAAEGALEKCADGRVRITRVTLRPRIAWAGDAPDAAALGELHHQAHENCFIANSITAEVVVEPR
ncbi:OsmC family protein [Sphingomonas mesophila]|uniref:OsmC family protein n=1 Tax=Sphingomonas mesophila TaxID=2303576 RepID=UPI000E56F094|nr:OsmC family protein [Sphingomonas mesophila]